MNAASLRERQVAGDSLEVAGVLLFFVLVFVSVPVGLGRLGLSWDALNHHIYLGWAADSNRFARDYMAAGGQSTQFPYLYWPVYRLAAGNASGVVAGSVLALLHVLAVPPVWWVARLLVPTRDLAGRAVRVCAVILGFMSAVPLKTLESTGNDVLAAVPVLWAVAFALHVVVREDAGVRLRATVASGLLGGIAVACKLSNGPLMVLLPLVFAFAPVPMAARVRLALTCAFAIGAGFLLAYGYWGWQLWQVFGNPFYPFADGIFAPLRELAGWQP